MSQRSFSFKHIYAVGLVTSWLLFGCGGDSGEPAVPPAPKTNSPTTYVFKSSGLPEGVSVDAANKVLNVPETLSDADIKKLFESGTVSDKDGGAVLKSVVLSGDKVTLTLQGKNGKTGATDTTTQTWTVKRMAITAEFPNEIVAGNTIVAGDEEFFKTLFDKAFTLSDGSKAKLSKVLVNEQEVTATHIINVPETYTLQLSITKDGKEISKEYNLTVNYREAVEAPASTSDSFHRLGLKSVDTGIYSGSGTTERPEIGVKNMPNNYFQRLETINNFSPEMKKKIEDRMRAEPIVFDNREPIGDPDLDRSKYDNDTEGSTHWREQRLNFKGANGTSSGHAFNMGSDTNWEYAVQALNLTNIYDETQAPNLIDNLKTLGKSSLFISSSWVWRDASPDDRFTSFANWLASDECQMTVYLLTDDEDNASTGTEQERRDRTADNVTIVSHIAEKNPGAFRNIKIVQLTGGVSYYTPALAQLIKDNWGELIFSPERRGVITQLTGQTWEGQYTMWSKGEESYGWPQVTMNHIIAQHIVDELGLNNGEIPTTPYTWTEYMPHFPGYMLNLWWSDSNPDDGLEDMIWNSIDLPASISLTTWQQSTFGQQLPSKLTEMFDSNKIGVACPDGTIHTLDESIDISKYISYDLANHPFKIGFISTENGTKTIVPKVTWKTKITIN